MISITPAQEAYLRSTLVHILEKSDFPVSFSIVSDTDEKPLLAVVSTKSDSPLELRRSGEESSIPILRDDSLELLLRSLNEEGRTLFIDDGTQITRLSLRGDSVSRETVETLPPVLRQPKWAIGKVVHLDPNRAAPLLQAIGLMTPEGDIKAPMRKKFKQVDHFLDLLTPILAEKNSTGKIDVVDCGCGKTYLGFVLFWYIRRVMKRSGSFIGIDTSASMIKKCIELAESLSLGDMRFQCSSIREAEIPKPVDLLVSLHACDTATDEAIAAGVVNRARHIVVAPCCQHEIAGQITGIPMYPLARHGIFKQRYADLLTDMTRALFLEANGYTVVAGEFISSEETPKNLLLRARYGNKHAKKRMNEYEAFKNHYGLNPSVDRFRQELELQRRCL